MEDVNRLGGFTFSDEGNKFKCVCCNVETEAVSSEMNNEELSRIHILNAPFCANVKALREFRKMRVVRATIVDADPDQHKDDLPQGKNGTDLPDGFYPAAKHELYMTGESRVNSFHNVQGLKVPVSDFLAAGFFHNSPPPDKVTCFWCDGSLEGWNQGEIPLTEHAKYYPCCAYLRQIIGTDKIYSIRETMEAREVEAANNLIYSMNPEILYTYYPKYKDTNMRVRSLIFGNFTENQAFSLAIQGFYYSDEDERRRVKCYYCGFDMNIKGIDFERVKDKHEQWSPKCYQVTSGNSHQLQAAPDDTERELQCFPCNCFILRSEYDPDKKICLYRGCGKEVKYLTSCRRLRTV